jgi:hypothetical protein
VIGGNFGKILAGILFCWMFLLWTMTSSGSGVNTMADYKGKVLQYKKSIREGSKNRGTHYGPGRTGYRGK